MEIDLTRNIFMFHTELAAIMQKIGNIMLTHMLIQNQFYPTALCFSVPDGPRKSAKNFAAGGLDSSLLLCLLISKNLET